MKNFEHWEKEVKEIASTGDQIAVVKGKPAYCYKTSCDQCYFNMTGELCCVAAINWFYAEYQENPEDKA